MTCCELTGIDTYYGQIHILQGLDIEVGGGRARLAPRGKCVRKSTTLKTILGHCTATDRRGRVRRRERHRPVDELPDRPGMAIVPENRRLFGPMTVLENLQMGAYLHGGGAKEDFERVYSLFPLLYERRGSSRRPSPAASSRWSR